MSDNSKSPARNGHSKKEHKISKQAKKQPRKGKVGPKEFIDVEQEQPDKKAYDPSDLFLGALARKCTTFLDWLSDSRPDSLSQLLWKNSMTLRAGQRYPELNNNELARLVDRDWKYMPEEERNKICSTYSTLPTEFQLQRAIGGTDPILYC